MSLLQEINEKYKAQVEKDNKRLGNENQQIYGQMRLEKAILQKMKDCDFNVRPAENGMNEIYMTLDKDPFPLETKYYKEMYYFNKSMDLSYLKEQLTQRLGCTALEIEIDTLWFSDSVIPVISLYTPDFPIDFNVHGKPHR